MKRGLVQRCLRSRFVTTAATGAGVTAVLLAGLWYFQESLLYHPVVAGVAKLTKDNNRLGQFTLGGIPPMPRGVPLVEVTLEGLPQSLLQAYIFKRVVVDGAASGVDVSVRLLVQSLCLSLGGRDGVIAREGVEGGECQGRLRGQGGSDGTPTRCAQVRGHGGATDCEPRGPHGCPCLAHEAI